MTNPLLGNFPPLRSNKVLFLSSTYCIYQSWGDPSKGRIAAVHWVEKFFTQKLLQRPWTYSDTTYNHRLMWWFPAAEDLNHWLWTTLVRFRLCIHYECRNLKMESLTVWQVLRPELEVTQICTSVEYLPRTIADLLLPPAVPVVDVVFLALGSSFFKGPLEPFLDCILAFCISRVKLVAFSPLTTSANSLLGVWILGNLLIFTRFCSFQSIILG